VAKPFPSQAAAILRFYRSLRPEFKLPLGVEVLNPYRETEAWELTQQFYHKYYGDKEPRTFIFGINPGRFGGGVTGIPFTDPIRLESACGIINNLKKVPELSSQFIYNVIDEYGGAPEFYGQFFVTALCSLGFIQKGKNLNYYDHKELLQTTEPFIVESIHQQLRTIRATTALAYCLGEGENYRQFCRLNARHHFFDSIAALPHPRWIMQYRRKAMRDYVRLYVEHLGREKKPDPVQKP
jgi:Domain of unknown function (DUF4918)